ncbi:galactose oxidase [Chloropicon primus]|uniref:Galactose oxidase n=2 Tax=Chloropicon primus TaxID=1764295 RepID=A0A5B8ML09_9CHLO|nr:galactose oxidase [Chloropicon primus]UPQ99292.1 galactose oxidase [Chloropicon primus]|mmetsp:Transcript_8724/g.24901  ORF Transcript_8724/g.24901 Transcript_8724/m.24901 type:complete len:428 (+) Transcript_8724:254-1537(+)|eukprot:QDZ20080.1 galactose oxidase [Chloropicon primus]
MPWRETSYLLGREPNCIGRARNWATFHPVAAVLLSILGLLLVVTVVVVPTEWVEISGGTPPACSKGGVAAVMSGPSRGTGEAEPFLSIFSGDAKHGELIAATKKYELLPQAWRDFEVVPDVNFGTPEPRWKSVAVVDSSATRLFMFGGLTGTAYPADVWTMAPDEDGNAIWSFVEFEGSAAVAPGRKAAAAVNIGGTMLVFGGKWCEISKKGKEKHCKELGDLWTLDLESLSTWEKLWEFAEGSSSPDTGGPSPRHGHSATVATIEDEQGRVTDYMVVFAGRADAGYYNDVWAWNTRARKWEDWTPGSAHPTPAKRDHHHVASPQGKRMVLFGGRGDPDTEKHQHKNSNVLGDLWEFDYKKRKWEAIQPSAGRKPSARFLADFAEHEETLLVFGGDEESGKGGRLDDLWQLNLTTYAWTELHQGLRC